MGGCREYYDKLADKQGWKRVFNINVFIACVSFSIVLPSLWPYLLIITNPVTDEEVNYAMMFLAYIFAVYSVGEFIGTLLGGALYRCCSAKCALLTSIFIGFLGSILYSGGIYFPSKLLYLSTQLAFGGEWVILIGRFLQGLWTGGQQAIEQAYIHESIKRGKSFNTVSDLGTASMLGFIFGPIIGYLVTFVNLNLGPVVINPLTSVGII